MSVVRICWLSSKSTINLPKNDETKPNPDRTNSEKRTLEKRLLWQLLQQMFMDRHCRRCSGISGTQLPAERFVPVWLGVQFGSWVTALYGSLPELCWLVEKGVVVLEQGCRTHHRCINCTGFWRFFWKCISARSLLSSNVYGQIIYTEYSMKKWLK